MKKVIELEFECIAETKQYYTFKLSKETVPLQFLPNKKIYLLKELFSKPPKTIIMVATEIISTENR